MLLISFTNTREPEEIARLVTVRAFVHTGAVFKKAVIASFIADALRFGCAGMIVMPACEEDAAMCARLCPQDWRFFVLKPSGENIYRLTEI